ncbi:MAG: hypothetical protein V8R52_14005 [Coprobacter fastidiosus]
MLFGTGRSLNISVTCLHPDVSGKRSLAGYDPKEGDIMKFLKASLQCIPVSLDEVI